MGVQLKSVHANRGTYGDILTLKRGALETWQLGSVWAEDWKGEKVPCFNYLPTTVGQSSIRPTLLALLIARLCHFEETQECLFTHASWEWKMCRSAVPEEHRPPSLSAESSGRF